jgi:hypothetical protein
MSDDCGGMDAFNTVLDRLESYAGDAKEMRSRMEEAQQKQREAEREVTNLRERLKHLQIQLDVANQRIAEMTPPPGPKPWTPPSSPGALDAVKAALKPPDDMPF